ncbi:MAG: DUF1566 domain-containing protein, partial [Candidatus Promineifilaceae bacterium]
GLMLTQYLSPMLLFMGVTLLSIFWPAPGALLHGVLALFAAWFFNAQTNLIALLFALPLIGFGALYWYGRPRPRRLAAAVIVALPLLTLTLSGISPALRVSQRIDDGDLQARLVEGNGVTLIWAPEGPGWPGEGLSWFEAREACRALSDDGLSAAASPQNIWRLPTVDEAVRSMARHGRNSGGVWDSTTAQETYETTPDKESPLWNTHSQVIYWWTATEVDEETAAIIAYDGRVWPRKKSLKQDYLGFRCVKEP